MSARTFSVLKTLMGRERMVETEPVNRVRYILMLPQVNNEYKDIVHRPAGSEWHHTQPGHRH